MTVDYNNPEGLTLDRQRFLIVKCVGSGASSIWLGEQSRPVRRAVLISYGFPGDSEMEWLRYDVPGIAPLLFIGSPDGFRVPPGQSRPGPVAVVEAMPAGETLHQIGRLVVRDVVRVGIGLCDMLLASDTRGVVVWGLRPETVFAVSDGPAGYRYAGATPRSYRFLGGPEGSLSPFPLWFCHFDPPEYPELTSSSGVSTAALILWYALLGEHAFVKEVGTAHQHWATADDVRRPFTGPPELGRLLEAALVADVEKRMTTAELRDALVGLARLWDIELPPFPPPGLEGP